MSDYGREQQLRELERELELPSNYFDRLSSNYFDRNDPRDRPIDVSRIIGRLENDPRWQALVLARRHAHRLLGNKRASAKEWRLAMSTSLLKYGQSKD